MAMVFDADEMKRGEEAVIAGATEELVSRLRESVSGEVKKMVREQFIQSIRETVGAIILEMVDEGFVPVNEYGEPKGAKKTLREAIGDAARKYLAEKVDSRGEASTYGGSETRLSFI